MGIKNKQAMARDWGMKEDYMEVKVHNRL